MTNFPKISIVTVNYNLSHFLEETIKSVIDQQYPNLEYIIIDGGSTDDSVDIIKKYEKFISFWISEKDEGIYDALQKGFSKSSGEIMGWLNSDDLYHPKLLFVVGEIFSRFNQINWLTGVNTFFYSMKRGNVSMLLPQENGTDLIFYRKITNMFNKNLPYGGGVYGIKWVASIQN